MNDAADVTAISSPPYISAPSGMWYNIMSVFTAQNNWNI